MRSVFDTVAYYRKYIQNCAEIVEPILNRPKKCLAAVWSSTCETAFQTLKEYLTSASILAYSDVNYAEYILDTVRLVCQLFHHKYNQKRK